MAHIIGKFGPAALGNLGLEAEALARLWPGTHLRRSDQDHSGLKARQVYENSDQF